MKNLNHQQYWQVIVDDNHDEINLFDCYCDARELFDYHKNDIIKWSPSEITKISSDEFEARWDGLWGTTIRSIKIKSVLASINSLKEVEQNI